MAFTFGDNRSLQLCVWSCQMGRQPAVTCKLALALTHLREQVTQNREQSSFGTELGAGDSLQNDLRHSATERSAQRGSGAALNLRARGAADFDPRIGGVRVVPTLVTSGAGVLQHDV